MSVRLSVNINDETAQAIRDLRDDRDINVNEVIARAAEVCRYLQAARDAGREIVLVKGARHWWQRDEYTHLELLP